MIAKSMFELALLFQRHEHEKWKKKEYTVIIPLYGHEHNCKLIGVDAVWWGRNQAKTIHLCLVPFLNF